MGPWQSKCETKIGMFYMQRSTPDDLTSQIEASNALFDMNNNPSQEEMPSRKGGGKELEDLYL